MNGNDNLSLELEASNGWDVQDMFRKNEQDYGVQSTFDHSLRGYTVALQTSDSPDYREAQAKAEQIANEIGLCSSRLLENLRYENVCLCRESTNVQSQNRAGEWR